MKKYLLLLALLFVPALSSDSGTRTTINTNADWYYFHPQLTTSDGLMTIADKIVDHNILLNKKEVLCMAKNIFFEAAVESTAGKLAVAQVTLNRVNSDKFPMSICDVVYEGQHYTARDGQQLPKRDRCQFSWYCDGKGDEPPVSRLWDDAQDLAKYVILRQDDLPDITDGATYYHAHYIDAPRWTTRKKVTATIDQHIFYRVRGSFNSHH